MRTMVERCPDVSERFPWVPQHAIHGRGHSAAAVLGGQRGTATCSGAFSAPWRACGWLAWPGTDWTVAVPEPERVRWRHTASACPTRSPGTHEGVLPQVAYGPSPGRAGRRAGARARRVARPTARQHGRAPWPDSEIRHTVGPYERQGADVVPRWSPGTSGDDGKPSTPNKEEGPLTWSQAPDPGAFILCAQQDSNLQPLDP